MNSVSSCAQDPPDHLRMTGSSIPRAIEVDDMEPVRSGGLERRRYGDRVVAVIIEPIEVPLLQPHDATIDQVDRGQDLEP